MEKLSSSNSTPSSSPPGTYTVTTLRADAFGRTRCGIGRMGGHRGDCTALCPLVGLTCHKFVIRY